MKSFSINEALSAGWAGFKSQPWFFIKLLLVYGVLWGSTNAVVSEIKGWIAIPFLITFQLFLVFLGIGLLRIWLNVIDGGKGSLEELFAGGPLFVSYLSGSLLYSLIGILGLLLLVAPGIIWFIMCRYYEFFIVDRRLGPVEALKASAALTKGVRWKLFGFGMVIALLNIAGFLLLIVGAFITVPVSMLATAFVYRKLLSQTQTA